MHDRQSAGAQRGAGLLVFPVGVTYAVGLECNVVPEQNWVNLYPFLPLQFSRGCFDHTSQSCIEEGDEFGMNLDRELGKTSEEFCR